MLRLSFALLIFITSFAGATEFTLNDDGTHLSVLEGSKPVLVYNYGRIDPPASVSAERYWRSSYIHPLYGVDGEILTDDFPVDHFHHRGVFWTWPEVFVGARKMDVWTIVGARQLFKEWLTKEATDTHAEIGVRNVWRFDDDSQAKIEETVHIKIHPAQDNTRAIDFHLVFKNVSGEKVVFEGAKNKGYGGLCFRPDARNKPFTFYAQQGKIDTDVLRLETPWASIGWKEEGKETSNGVAIFQHPSNPGFPHPGWIFRHYAFLGASWPHEQSHELEPEASFELRYRMITHQKDTSPEEIQAIFGQYLKDNS